MTTNKKLRRAPWLLAAALGLLGTAQAAPPGNGDPEICDNGIDDDEDRKIDCADRDCRDDPACNDGGGEGGSFPYRVAAVLSCPPGANSCAGRALDDEATRIAGGGDGDTDSTACGDYTREHALLWDLDAMGAVAASRLLPHTPAAGGQDVAYANDVNVAGQACGGVFWRFGANSAAPSDGNCSRRWQPAVWQRDASGGWTLQPTPLPMPADATSGGGNVINDLGWVLGGAAVDLDGDDWNDTVLRIVWVPDSAAPSGYLMETLPTPSGVDSYWAWDLNDSGRVVGYLQLDTGVRQPIVWDRTAPGAWAFEILDTLGGVHARAYGVNSQGDVVGRSHTGYTERFRGRYLEPIHAVRWTQDPASGTWLAPEDLGRIAGFTAEGWDLDDSGVVLGLSDVDNELRRHGALWRVGEDPVRLDEQIDGDWTFHSVDDIAGASWILANGTEGNSEVVQDVLMVPTTP